MIRFLAVAAVLLLSGCADFSYYMHSVGGHLDVMTRSRDIKDVLNDAATSEKLRQRLELVGRIRDFAFDELKLPSSDSYTEYADLERDYAVKSLFAAEEFSIAAHQWCYPVIGCAGYRGYYDEARLQRYIEGLKARRFDVHVARVPAYSTLGWFDDPVLNTFIHWPEYRLAGLIFHELSHQRLYIDGDSTFNESFAIAVQQEGVIRWLRGNDKMKTLNAYLRHLENRNQVLAFIVRQRLELADLYSGEGEEQAKRGAKAAFFDSMREQYRELSAGFAGSDGFSKWFEGELNNAKLVSISTYHALVPAFRRLLRFHGGDFEAFFAHVERIAELESRQRGRCLEDWLNTNESISAGISSLTDVCPDA